MTSTMFGGRAHRIYGDKIVKQNYAAGFVLPLVLKDVRLALAEAEKAGVPMPSVNVVRVPHLVVPNRPMSLAEEEPIPEPSHAIAGE